jgi:DNA-directed RNA polymerase specialized sigma24 family protein
MPPRWPFGPADDARTEPRDQEVDRQARREALAARLEEDRQTVERLAADGFEGPAFERFAADLVARGYRTMDSWTRPPRVIFIKCADRGIPLTQREWTADERFDLVQDTVSTGYRRFCDGALRRREWKAERGAGLFTFFAGGLIYAFSEHYRTWQAAAIARSLQVRELTPEMGMVLADPRQRPGAVVIDRDTVMRALNSLDPRLAKVLALTDEQYSQKEIADKLADGTTPRAVEAILRRHRNSLPGKGTRP